MHIAATVERCRLKLVKTQHEVNEAIAIKKTQSTAKAASSLYNRNFLSIIRQSFPYTICVIPSNSTARLFGLGHVQNDTTGDLALVPAQEGEHDLM